MKSNWPMEQILIASNWSMFPADRAFFERDLTYIRLQTSKISALKGNNNSKLRPLLKGILTSLYLAEEEANISLSKNLLKKPLSSQSILPLPTKAIKKPLERSKSLTRE